jgi:quinohemoprotein ethanol dehydrogenase
MKHKGRLVIALAVGLVALLSVTAGAVAHIGGTQRAAITIPAFSTSDLDATPGNNWIVQQGNLSGQRHSSLTGISPSNVSGLKQAWHVKITTATAEPLLQLGGEAPQIEYNGTIFAEDEYGRVYARNATTGAAIWVYEPHSKKINIPAKDQGVFKIAGPWASTRGLAMDSNMIFAEEQTGKMVALDANTGKQVWANQISPSSQGIGLSEPPTIFDGMVLGSTSGGDTGFPCYGFALDEKTGKTLWKFNFIPQKNDPTAYQTWTHPLPFYGGGAEWAAQTVDSKDGLVYYGIGNPIPYAGLLRGPGQEHYTDGVLALHAKTGKFAWFFQEVHHDIWDADQSQEPMLANDNGKQVIVSADKDGLWYVLDAATGKPVIPVKETPVQQSKAAHTYATQPIPATDPLVPQNVPNRAKWKGLTAPDGKPFNIGPGGPAGSFTAIDSSRYSVTAAFGQGASGNKPASIDGNLLLEETTPGFSTFQAIPNSEVGKLSYFNFNAILDLKIGSLKGTPAAASGTRIEAMNINTGKMVWSVDRVTPTNPAKLATAQPFSGGLLTSNGILWTTGGSHLQAFSEKNGKLLWSSPLLKGQSLGPPTTYAVGGRQFVTTLIAGSGDLYAFALPS